MYQRKLCSLQFAYHSPYANNTQVLKQTHRFKISRENMGKVDSSFLNKSNGTRILKSISVQHSYIKKKIALFLCISPLDTCIFQQ